MKTRSHGCFWLLGGGVKACCRAGFRRIDLVEKFRSLEVEKDLKIILSAETSLRLMSACSPRPITAPTSQVGEVAVVRTPVSYKCGWGSNKTNPHPNLPQLGKECACVARLTHIPYPLKTTSLRGNIHSARSNPERITQLKTVDISLNCNEKFTINHQIRFSK